MRRASQAHAELSAGCAEVSSSIRTQTSTRARTRASAVAGAGHESDDCTRSRAVGAGQSDEPMQQEGRAKPRITLFAGVPAVAAVVAHRLGLCALSFTPTGVHPRRKKT